MRNKTEKKNRAVFLFINITMSADLLFSIIIRFLTLLLANTEYEKNCKFLYFIFFVLVPVHYVFYFYVLPFCSDFPPSNGMMQIKAACGKSNFSSLNFVVLIQHFNFFSLQSAQRTYICICFTVRICTIFVIIYPANFSQLCRLRNDLCGAARLFRMITLIVCCQRGFYAKCSESSRFSVCFYYHYYYYSLNTHEK